MTRLMADTTDHSAPGGYDAYAGYMDGHYQSYPYLKSQHSDKPVIPISVFGDPNSIAVDVETGDVTPAHAPSYVKAQGNTWYMLWVAAYGVSHCPVPGAVAWQKADSGPHGENIDISEIYDDNWPHAGISNIYCPASWAESVKSYCAQAGLTFIPAGQLQPVPTPKPKPFTEDQMPTITIPAPDLDDPETPKDADTGKPFAKGTVPFPAGTKGLVYIATDNWPNNLVPNVRVAIGTGRPDSSGNREHWAIYGSPQQPLPVANFPVVLGYDATKPWTAGPGGDEQASVVNYGPGEITVSAVPTE